MATNNHRRLIEKNKERIAKKNSLSFMKEKDYNRTTFKKYESETDKLRKRLTMEEKLANPNGEWSNKIEKNNKKQKNSRLLHKKLTKKSNKK